jgi:uncharacterized iron-regulated membrane protein
VKVAPRTFKIQWDLHAWVGVVASLLSFVIFYCGVFALFNGAFTSWQGPASEPTSGVPEPSRVSYDRVVAEIERTLTIPRGAAIFLRLPLGQRVEPGTATVSVYHDPTGLARDFAFDRISGELRPASAEHSRLADELNSLHFFYQLPWGIELSGLVAVGLFVALVSGLLIQWKDLMRQLWQFRPQLRLRFSASDAHKVLGVLGLPFATLFAWSGALLGLLTILQTFFQHGVFGGDRSALDAALTYRSPISVAAPPAGRPLSLDELVVRGLTAATTHFAPSTPLEVERMDIEPYADESARFELTFTGKGFQKARSVELDASGHVTRMSAVDSAPSEAIDRVLFDLHYARYGGYLVKALYALLSLAVCVVIVTGNLVWLERRDRARSRLGNRVLERLTVGVCFGLVFSSAVYCAANRLLPAGLARRADLELGIWLVAWAASVGAAFFRWPSRTWAAALCRAAAFAFGGALLADLATRPAQVLAAWGGRADPWLAAELVLVALGILCSGLSRGLRRPTLE